jgi:hypothetical protein
MGNGIYRLGWGVAAVFALLFAASMSGIVQGGALDPPGAPASTMKTLDDIGAWNRTLSATGGCTSERFDCVLAGDVGVLDRETGLVWQRDPDSVTTTIWVNAAEACNELLLGGRFGWRLPTIDEFYSLVDASADGMPDGHPFTVIATDLTTVLYWSATTNPATPTGTWAIVPATADTGLTNVAKSSSIAHWCVRGGKGLEGQ